MYSEFVQDVYDTLCGHLWKRTELAYCVEMSLCHLSDQTGNPPRFNFVFFREVR